MNIDGETSSADEDTGIVIDITGEDTTQTVANDHSNVSSLDAAYRDMDFNDNAREDDDDVAEVHGGQAVALWRARRDAERAQWQAAERAKREVMAGQALPSGMPAHTATTFSESQERASSFRFWTKWTQEERAIYSQWGRPALEKLSMTENIFIDGLPKAVTINFIKTVFSAYGTVLDCSCLPSEQPGQKGAALVRFSSSQEAKTAIEATNGRSLPHLLQAAECVCRRKGGQPGRSLPPPSR